MKRLFGRVAAAVFLGLSLTSAAADYERFAGKWKAKTDFQGAEVDINVEVTGKTMKFDIGGDVVGKATATLSKHDGFRILTFTDLEVGESWEALTPVDAESKHIYTFGYRSFTLASNFDSTATEDPKLVVYKKVE